MSEGLPSGHIELSLRLGELNITISGPPEAATRFVREVTSRPSEAGGAASPRSDNSFTVVATEASAPPRGESRSEIEATFSDPPEDLLVLGRRLPGCEQLGGEGRISRAWKAGCWAGAVLSGRVGSPNRSQQISLRPRIYVVIRADGLSEPACFSSSASFFRAVGDLATSNALCHSWPSEAEAKAYCRGAGIAFPTIQPWWRRQM